MSRKICSVCKIDKPFTDYYRDKSRKPGITSACKPCMDARHAQWRKKNPGKSRHQSRIRWEKYLSLVREKQHLEFQRSNRFAALVLRIGLFFVRRYFAMKEVAK